MTETHRNVQAHSHLLEGSPRLHYLEWNPDASNQNLALF